MTERLLAELRAASRTAADRASLYGACGDRERARLQTAAAARLGAAAEAVQEALRC